MLNQILDAFLHPKVQMMTGKDLFNSVVLGILFLGCLMVMEYLYYTLKEKEKIK